MKPEYKHGGDMKEKIRNLLHDLLTDISRQEHTDQFIDKWETEILALFPSLDNEQLKKIEEVLSARFLVEVKDDPDFTAFARAIPDKHWSKYDLSAVRLGWEAHKILRVKGE